MFGFIFREFPLSLGNLQLPTKMFKVRVRMNPNLLPFLFFIEIRLDLDSVIGQFVLRVIYGCAAKQHPRRKTLGQIIC